ncbi:MAG: hypothetical protein U9O41_10575, partial [Candidatus Aerophobetes bacterium]|nr:hypothetical protein [Candidatus Aerophobetes bacterium]
HTMETTRAKLINHGGSIEFTDHICRIRINQTYPYKQEVYHILERMRKESKFTRYRSWYYTHGVY